MSSVVITPATQGGATDEPTGTPRFFFWIAHSLVWSAQIGAPLAAELGELVQLAGFVLSDLSDGETAQLPEVFEQEQAAAPSIALTELVFRVLQCHPVEASGLAVKVVEFACRWCCCWLFMEPEGSIPVTSTLLQQFGDGAAASQLMNGILEAVERWWAARCAELTTATVQLLASITTKASGISTLTCTNATL